MKDTTRTKALVLGAQPPFEGPWVPIREARAWGHIVHIRPGDTLDGDQIVTILVMDEQGDVTPLARGELIRGIAARALLRPSDDAETVSVHIEVVE